MAGKKKRSSSYPFCTVVFRERGPRPCDRRSPIHYLGREPRCDSARTLCGVRMDHVVVWDCRETKPNGTQWGMLVYLTGEATCPECRRIVRLRKGRPWTAGEAADAAR